MKHQYIYIIIIAISILSCSRPNDNIDRSLKLAGENAEELELIIRQFPDSSRERKAAEFLIANMPGHYSFSGNELKKYIEYFNAFGKSNSKSSVVADSLENIYGRFNSSLLTPVPDLTSITADYLSKEIMDAVNIWQAYPWSRDIPFSLFAEYILPYRIGNEELIENWHGAINDEISSVLDSLRLGGCKDPLEATKEIMRWWDAPHFKWTGQLPTGINVGPRLRHFHCGSCKETADVVVYLLRGAGVASAVDFDIMRGDANAPHLWSVAFNQHGKPLGFTSDYLNWIPTENYPLITSKVYRTTYSRHSFGKPKANDIPPKFLNAPMIDVTSDYGTTYTLDVKLRNPENNEHALLCNSCQLIWQPVAVGEIRKDRAIFPNVRPGAVTLVGCQRNGEFIPQSPPFLVKDSKRIHYFIPGDEWLDSEIYCKYPLSEKNGDVVSRVIGGQIQGSDYKDFRRFEVLHTISEFPKRKLTEVQIQASRPYRYYRYIGADSTYCNIAEVMLLDEKGMNISTNAIAYGTEGTKYPDKSHDFHAVFDGDWFTSFDFPEPSGGWAAVDMGKPEKISKIIYSPRNRDNYVRPGNLYELFYWNVKDGKWISLGKQETQTDYLKYKVPVGALLYLKNHTGGKDERIFEYNHSTNEQIFY